MREAGFSYIIKRRFKPTDTEEHTMIRNSAFHSGGAAGEGADL